MKKTIKLVVIFMAVMIVGITGGLSVYFLIQNNKTYYINDLRIVEPISAASTYVYRNKENEYKTMKNQKVYMTANSDNYFEIAVFTDTTANMDKLKITSSDNNVASIVYIEGKCYVQYKKAGVATITASIDMVKDSFDLSVYNRVAEEFNVYDKTYYGDYYEMFSNKIIAYADDKQYAYDFSTTSKFFVQQEEEPLGPEIEIEEENEEGEKKPEKVIPTNDNEKVNGDLLEIDMTSVNTEVFENIKIDASSRKILVTCKSSLSTLLNSQRKSYVDESIVVQSYYYSTEGEKKPSKSYVVDVHVIADAPEFLQIIMSATPDFENSYVFMDTVTYEDKIESEIIANIDEFLSYQKAEQYLFENEEKSTYTGFFTERVSDVYLKFRKVYTNGDIEYLNPLTEDDNPFNLKYWDSVADEWKNPIEDGYLTLSQNKEYYTLNLDETYFNGHDNKFEVKVTLEDMTDFDSVFTFEYKDFTAANVTDFYKFDYKTKVFEYKYWDLRTRYYNEICNANGDIVNFGGISIDIKSLMPDEDVKFVSRKYERDTGRAIFEVEKGVSLKLTYECILEDNVGDVVFTVVEGNSALNSERFTLSKGVITISSIEFRQIVVRIEVDGSYDECIVRLKAIEE